ncbi:M24 family metallopeptidase [Parasphingorhabdus marina]
MVVDGVINESVDGELRDGTSVLIDCVSHFAGYHGDFGRTVFIGEPPQRTRSAVTAISDTIEELGRQMRSGMRFSEIPSIGQCILSKLGDFAVPFGPHSVGLAHTDQPQSDIDGGSLDIILEAGMIISVDCPLMVRKRYMTPV